MKWDKEWGTPERLEFLESLVEQGKNPPALENRTHLPYCLIEYYRAFKMLSGSRRLGMGVGPIPLSEIVAYLQIYPTHDVDLFIYLLMTMDDYYLE